MAALAAPVTLLNCPLPAINNIDVPTDQNTAQKEAIFKEVKTSLRFALLRSSASATVASSAPQLAAVSRKGG